MTIKKKEKKLLITENRNKSQFKIHQRLFISNCAEPHTLRMHYSRDFTIYPNGGNVVAIATHFPLLFIKILESGALFQIPMHVHDLI